MGFLRETKKLLLCLLFYLNLPEKLFKSPNLRRRPPPLPVGRLGPLGRNEWNWSHPNARSLFILLLQPEQNKRLVSLATNGIMAI